MFNARTPAHPCVFFLPLQKSVIADNRELMDKKVNTPQQIAAFVIIPFTLAVPPVLGWALGTWLDKKFNTEPYLMYIFLALGILSGIRECYRIIKNFGEDP